MSLTEQILAAVPADERICLFLLLDAAPAVVETIMGQRPHKSASHRWATRPSGPRLDVVKVPGQGRQTCRTWPVEFSEALADADRSAAKKSGPPRRKGRTVRIAGLVNRGGQR